MHKDIDILGLGRVAVDLYAEQVGARLAQAQTFRKYVGGSAGNVMIGSARLGLNTAMLSKVGKDEMGEYVLQTLKEEHVNIEYMQSTSDHLTGLVLLGVQPPAHFPLIFYREQCADMQMDVDLDPDAFARSKVLLLTGTGFSSANMRAVSNTAIGLAKNNQCQIALDLDYRPVLWQVTKRGDGETRFIAAEKVTLVYQSFLAYCDLIVGTEEEFLIAAGCDEIEQAIDVVAGMSQALLVVKRGANGCWICPPHGQRIAIASYKVPILNVLGAGDAFLSGFFAGWLRGEALEVCGEMANANGALVVTRHGCAPAMPYQEELQYYMCHQQQSFITLQSGLDRKHQQYTISECPKPQFILAFDHRWQFEQDAKAKGLGKEDIITFKNKVFEGFCQVVESQPALQPHLGLLIDPIYGQEIIHQANLRNLNLGVPIEKAGSHPIEWLESVSVYQQLLKRPKHWFVKVLWRLDSDFNQINIDHQIAKLKELDAACNQLERSLMLELITDSLPWALEKVVGAGVYPARWKVKPSLGQKEWQTFIDGLQQYDAKAEVIILGGGASTEQLAALFQMVKHPQTAGFAIGRTIFQQAWRHYLEHPQELASIVFCVQEQLLRLIQLWQNTSITNPQGVAVCMSS